MRCKVFALDIKKLLLKLDLDRESRRSDRARDPHMVRTLVHYAESRLERIAFLVQGHHLHDVRVADTYATSMRQ